MSLTCSNSDVHTISTGCASSVLDLISGVRPTIENTRNAPPQVRTQIHGIRLERLRGELPGLKSHGMSGGGREVETGEAEQSTSRGRREGWSPIKGEKAASD